MAAKDFRSDSFSVVATAAPVLVFGGCYSNLEATLAPHADAETTEEERQWMRSLPRRIDLLLGGCR